VSFPNDEQIRERAYQLWQDARCPEDREQEFWHLARTCTYREGERS